MTIKKLKEEEINRILYNTVEWTDEKRVYGFCSVILSVSKETNIDYRKIIADIDDKLAFMIYCGWGDATTLERSKIIIDWCELLGYHCRSYDELSKDRLLRNQDKAIELFTQIYKEKKNNPNETYTNIIRKLKITV